MANTDDLASILGTREVYFEFIPVGTTVKVCAIDAKTGIEVSIVGPAHYGSAHLKRTAARKLIYVMTKQDRL